jgi:hypothetical protein
MTYAVVLLALVVTMLVAYALGALVAHRRARDVTVVVVLALTAYWTLIGAVQILSVKAGNPAARATYLEDRLFRVDADGTYAAALLAYSVFLVVVVVMVVALVRERTPASVETEGDDASRFAATMAHGRLLAVVGVLTVAKVAVLALVVRGHSISDLYELTRTAGGDRRITVYQYLNVATAYPLACAVAIWIGARPAARAERRAVGLAYGALFGLALVENAALGNRAVPLVCLTGVAVGWVRWRFLPAGAGERRRLGVRFAGAAAAGLLLVGLIGAVRGGGSARPQTVVDAVGSVANSSEKLAAHLSLDGVLQLDQVRLRPLTGDSYAQYADLVGAPSDQVFTVHYVTAWWVRIGAVGVLAAALSYGLALALLQRLATARPTRRLAPFVVAAATLTAAGLPITLLRSGPESLRAVVVELTLIPALVLFAAFAGRPLAEEVG